MDGYKRKGVDTREKGIDARRKGICAGDKLLSTVHEICGKVQERKR